MNADQKRAAQVFDFLADRPGGATIDDIAADLGVLRGLARDAVRTLRLQLGDMDEVWLIAEPQPNKGRWLYRLSAGTAMLDPADPDGRWMVNRVLDAESRIRTMRSQMDAAVRSTSGRTTIGKKARVLAEAYRRLEYDFAEIDGRL